MKKRGQFYLVSAIIFAVILIGLAVISNYSTKPDITNVETLKEQIQTESARTVDYGISSQYSQGQMFNLLVNFTQQYVNAESRDNNLYFVFGTIGSGGNITVDGYQKTNINVSLDGNQVTSSEGSFLYSETPSPSATSAVLGIGPDQYAFNLKDGENFYFVVSQTEGSEVDVING